MYMYVYIYIYIRDRERYTCIPIYIYIYVYTYARSVITGQSESDTRIRSTATREHAVPTLADEINPVLIRVVCRALLKNAETLGSDWHRESNQYMKRIADICVAHQPQQLNHICIRLPRLFELRDFTVSPTVHESSGLPPSVPLFRSCAAMCTCNFNG